MSSRASRHSVSTTSSNASRASISIWDAIGSTPQTTPFSSPASILTRPSSHDSAGNGALLFSRPVTVSFSKGTSLFRIPLSRIDVCKDAAGGIRKINMSSDSSMRENVFTLNFPNSRMPIPHLEQPYSARPSSAYRISFLEEQTLQSGGSLFQGKPSFAFDRWEDCLRLQEAILGQQVVFVGGMAEAKSKRGEECISQNLRILRSNSSAGKAVMIFFTNSQRRERRRYVSVPLGAIGKIESGRRSITMKLSGDTELLADMKSLTVHFLEDEDRERFLSIVRN
jgi:hypothetical protein